MVSDEISVISVQQIDNDEDTEEVTEISNKLCLRNIGKALGYSIFGIIGIPVLFSTPWTTIPRTDSIIYPPDWIELLLLFATNPILTTGARFLAMKIWIKEEKLMSIRTYLKMYLLEVIVFDLFYISCYVVWSIHFQFNHPCPYIGLVILPTWLLFPIGLWFVPPSDLMAKKEFRQKLKGYMLYQLWVVMAIFLREIISYIFAKVPDTIQFLVPILLAGCRELDKRSRSKLVTKIMGVQDEAAAVLVAITISSVYSFFIAIRLVGSTYATICSTLIIDFCLHLKLTIQIIKEYNKPDNSRYENRNSQRSTKLATLITTELIEGFTPIIYLICVAMAYYGPNANLLTNIGSRYWGKKIEDFSSLLATMVILFTVDTFSVLINALCILKASKINILPEFGRIIGKYWYLIAINLGMTMNKYFASIDINLGIDPTRSFKWITNEGWINLVNTSTEITNEEKAELIAKTILQ